MSAAAAVTLMVGRALFIISILKISFGLIVMIVRATSGNYGCHGLNVRHHDDRVSRKVSIRHHGDSVSLTVSNFE
jgi:hypothetical protein